MNEMIEMVTLSSSKAHLIKALDDAKQFIQTAPLKYISDEYNVKWYKDLCSSLTALINATGKVCRESSISIDKQMKESILLHLTQLLTLLALFIDIFLQESNLKVSVIEARKYGIKQLISCLNGLESTLLTVDVSDCETGCFIKWMNIALENITRLSITEDKNKVIESFGEVKTSFEEVLCHGMSIAQVALTEDCNIIKGSSQSVLETLTSLHNEILKQDLNKAMANLFKDACRIKLCNLEERVNVAVLKLCAEVFSDYTTYLNKIHNFCMDIQNKGKTEELEATVVDFDLHVDRIMQIGLFAISCSSEGNYGIKIKSCLASLEALENELVPAFYTLLADGSFQSKHYAKVLKRHWEQQANQLKNCVYHIIEPYAFCRVINKQMKTTVQALVEKCQLKGILLDKSCFRLFLNYAAVFKEFVFVILSIEVDQNRKEKVSTSFKEFRKVLREVNAAIYILLCEDNRSLYNCTRIIKRCKLLIATSENLQELFEDDLDNKENEAIGTPEHSSVKPPTEVNNKFLEHIINRGKLILNERSILYKTPTKTPKSPKNQNCGAIRKNIASKNISRCLNQPVQKHSRVNFATPLRSNTQISFDITEILNDLTQLTINFKGVKD